MDFSGIKAISDQHGSVKKIESNGRAIWEKNADTRIFGVEWGRTSTSVWTRTDDAVDFTDPVPYVAGMTAEQCSSPFDSIMPWRGMRKVTDSAAGVLVAIPKFYYKWSNDDTKMKLQISPSPQDGFLVSPAHLARNANETDRSVVYVGRYHCAENWKSEAGGLPKSDRTRAMFRDAIHDLGTNLWQWDHAMLWTIRMLYLVEFANANSQAMIGYGCSPSGIQGNMGYTDSMPYHTGTIQSSRTTYGGTQYRYIEGLWDNVNDFVDGIYFNSANVYHILDPAKFSDNANGVLTGTRATTSNYIRSFAFPDISGYEWAGHPNDAAGVLQTAHFCDGCLYTSTGVVLNVGGYQYRSSASGLFYWDGSVSASGWSSSVGSRLMKLP